MLCRRKKNNALRIIRCGTAAVSAFLPFILGLSISIIPWRYSLASVSFLDVGQGDCIHIHTAHKDILIDGGGSYYKNIAEDTLVPYFLKNGVKSIDLAVATHPDLDHSRGLEELSNLMKIETAAYPAGYEEAAFSRIISENRMAVSAGDVLDLGDGVRLCVISPVEGREYKESNDGSLVCLLEYKGVRFLLTGDAGTETEDELLLSDSVPVCDILKCGHHGSGGSTGERFFFAADPVFSVISCGRNNRYGHPSQRITGLLENSGCRFARTDRDGAILIYIKKHGSFTVVNAAESFRTTFVRGII